MSDLKKLTAPQMKALQKLADSSDYFASLEAAAKNYGGLSEKQYASLQRDFWKADAPRLCGKPVRNKYTTEDGSPRCWTSKCERAATIVVGQKGVCKIHESDAIDEYNAFRESKTEAK